MAQVVVVGGHTRNVGKTGLAAGLIAGLPERRWTAVKITQYGHGVCSANGEACDCATADHALALSEERASAGGTDTARFLAAGAEKVFWLRTRQGDLAAAMPRLRALIAEAPGPVLLESNSVLRFLQPAVFLSVLDVSVADFKPSALRYLDRADAIVATGGTEPPSAWPVAARILFARLPRFEAQSANPCSAPVLDFVRGLLDRRAKKTGPEIAPGQ